MKNNGCSYIDIEKRNFTVPGCCYGYVDDDNIHVIDFEGEEIIPLKHLKVVCDDGIYVKKNYTIHDVHIYSSIGFSTYRLGINRSFMGFFPDIHLPRELMEDFLKIINFEKDEINGYKW